MLTLTTYATSKVLEQALNPALATGGFLAGCNVMLYTNQVEPSPESVIGDLDESSFAGYAKKVPTWLAPGYRHSDQAAEVFSDVIQFVAGALEAAEMVAGYALVEPASPHNLVALENFPSPFQLLEEGEAFQFVIQVCIGGSNNDNGKVQIIGD